MLAFLWGKCGGYDQSYIVKIIVEIIVKTIVKFF